VGPETNVYGIKLLNESEFKEFLHNES
jgi:hypothetical protein